VAAALIFAGAASFSFAGGADTAAVSAAATGGADTTVVGAAATSGADTAAVGAAAAAASPRAIALADDADEDGDAGEGEPVEESEVVRVEAPSGAKGVFAVDTVTGEILCAKSADKARPVASTSKLMTVWLVHEKIASGEGDWSDKVKIKDSKLDRMSRVRPYGGSVRLKKGKSFTVKQLYLLTLVESHNAAAVQLGRWVAGSDEDFAAAMNDAAAELGMEDSYFVNACGLNNTDYYKDLKIKYVGKRSDTNMMSPRDAATLAAALVTTYPEVMDATSIVKTKVAGKTVRTTNLILRDKKLKKKAKGLNVSGLKTGYIKRSGGCFIGSCEKEGRHRIVTVLLNDKKRFEHTISLMKDIYNENPDAV
jgi:D-alanyl-D-alanine carboxypeptidase (penicillin-binding protein 5/6)